MAFQALADRSNQNKRQCQYFGSSAQIITKVKQQAWTPLYKESTRSHVDDVMSRVAVVGPHVHVQQDLFVEASRKRGQRVLEAPRLLYNLSKVHFIGTHLSQQKATFNATAITFLRSVFASLNRPEQPRVMSHRL